MLKYMCNVCGYMHLTMHEAALCHPDVVVKEFPDLPDRAAELQRAPVQPAIELLRKLKNETGNGLDFISEETWEEINAVLKTAGGG